MAAGKDRGPRGWGEGAGGAGRPGHLLLELIGQEQELVLRESPDIELAEILELAVDLLLADPRPPADAEDEDGGSDTGIIGARKVLEDKEKDRRRFPPMLLTTGPAGKPREIRWERLRLRVGEGAGRKEGVGPCWFGQEDEKKQPV